MNKSVVISIVIIISILSISSTYAVNDNNIQNENNSLEVLWNQFVETIDYIFNHDPLHYIEPDNENNNDKNNTSVENINNTTTHNIHEENTIINDEKNDSHVLDSFKNSSGNSGKLIEDTPTSIMNS